MLAARTFEASEARREHAARKKAAHLTLDECRDAGAGRARSRLLEKRLEVVTHDTVNDGAFGFARLVVGLRRRVGSQPTGGRTSGGGRCCGRLVHAAEVRSRRATKADKKSHDKTPLQGGGRRVPPRRPPRSAMAAATFPPPYLLLHRAKRSGLSSREYPPD